MRQDNELEKHLLTRSYDSHSHIVEMLEERYSIMGEQKPYILFKPLRRTITTTPPKKTSRIRKGTRIELKEYFNKTISNQKKLVKKIQYYNYIRKSLDLEANLKYYKIPKFEDFINLHNIWQMYIRSLIFSADDYTKLQFPMNQVLTKLSSADYNGCLITVKQSKNCNIVGLRGIIVWDTQHSFIIVTPREELSREWNEGKSNFTPNELVGGFKIIPKHHSIFSFEIEIPTTNEVLEFSIIGSRFEIKSVDRSSKKFKNHSIEDIL
ncbi:unnamed protein product [Candida verbasci]|uniref:Ribonuclease P protein subunit n=1 Tax=Candida verbasci TaxID=1227364 RepID=A0A9W4U0C6_9ASCO|nr:unnamed protein product [Candida verbasci]